MRVMPSAEVFPRSNARWIESDTRIAALFAAFRSFRRIADGQFELLLAAPPRARYAVHASSNLLDWTAVTTVTSNDSSLIFIDPEPKDAARFYQAVLIP
jgi:hypothetical protein